MSVEILSVIFSVHSFRVKHGHSHSIWLVSTILYALMEKYNCKRVWLAIQNRLLIVHKLKAEGRQCLVTRRTVQLKSCVKLRRILFVLGRIHFVTVFPIANFFVQSFLLSSFLFGVYEDCSIETHLDFIVMKTFKYHCIVTRLVKNILLFPYLRTSLDIMAFTVENPFKK